MQTRQHPPGEQTTNNVTYRDSLRLKESQQSWEKTVQILGRDCFLDNQVTKLGELFSNHLFRNLFFHVGAHHALLILLANSAIFIFEWCQSVGIIYSERHGDYLKPLSSLKARRGPADRHFIVLVASRCEVHVLLD